VPKQEMVNISTAAIHRQTNIHRYCLSAYSTDWNKKKKSVKEVDQRNCDAVLLAKEWIRIEVRSKDAKDILTKKYTNRVNSQKNTFKKSHQ
jgi:hypothetical protein